jgi:hypothetical protein
MELICPDCRAQLVVVDAHNATCAGHDGRYQILFDRETGVVPDAPAAAALPDMPSSVVDSGTGMVTLNDISPRPAARMDFGFCAQHAEVQAVNRCRVCSKGMCVTCDFLLPGNIHVCPACLEQEPSTEISTKRKWLIGSGFVLGLFSIFMLVVTIGVGASGKDAQTVGAVLIFGMGIPAFIGEIVSLSAYDRRSRNGVILWIAMVLNGICGGLVLLAIIVGSFAGKG